VGRVEPFRNLDGQIEDGFYIHGAATDAVLQRLAIQEFHQDVRLAALLTNIVNRADIGVVQCEAACASR
jgi:hypothetical protein